MTEFKKYQHLERLGTTEVDGIETGTCYVFPKLDGTNASVWIDAEGNLKAGSRNRVLSQENDNAGFLFHVLQNEDTYRPYFEKHPNHILYGEWLVPHSLRTYRDTAWKVFYVFDVYNVETEQYLHYDVYSEELKAFNIEYIPPITIIKNGSDEQFRMCVEKNKYLIEEDQGFGEGVVVKNYEFVNQFGRVVWAKVISNSFKDIHHKEMGVPILGGISIEEKIANDFVTSHLVEKTYAKIVTEEDGWSSKYIPRLIQTVFYDLIQEETWNFIKAHKNPKVDFKYLQRLTTQRVKEIKPEVFN